MGVGVWEGSLEFRSEGKKQRTVIEGVDSVSE